MGNQTGRNSMDVVMELVQLHFKRVPVTIDNAEEEIERVYLKYYNLVKENR